MRSVEALLDQQRAHGIGRSVVYSPMEIQRAFRASEDPAAYAARYNTFLGEIQQRHSDEIVGAGIVYPFAGDASALEAERAVRELGLRAIMVKPYMRRAWLDQDGRAEPLLAAVEALGVPLILHPEEDLEREAAAALGRELRYAEGLVLWRTFATMLVLYGFACGPLLEKFPRLRLVFAHGGGGFWPNAARVELLFQELLPAEDPIVRGQWEGDAPARKPIEWQRAHEVYFDCAWFSGEALLGAVEQFGSDRFLFGTDGSAHGRSIDFYAGRFDALPLPAEDLQRIRYDNAARLFGASQV
jgi:aminocarboxymuconate-semialdehyde decarboxylase